MRRALTWLLALPVILVGSQAAHGLAYWWAYPQTDLRAAILSHTGHGYFTYAPIALGFLGAIELAAIIVAVADRLRGRGVRSFPAWAFLLIPAVGFTLQEYLERSLAGVSPWSTALGPSYWRGLVLQVPLGLIAWLIARLLLRTADALAEVITVGRQRPGFARVLVVSGVTDLVQLLRPAPLAFAEAGRAPPSFACV